MPKNLSAKYNQESKETLPIKSLWKISKSF